jgi:hypothetical protein
MHEVMTHNFILTICFLLGLSPAWGQTETTVNFRKSGDVVMTKGFRFSLCSSSDTVIVFNAAGHNHIAQTTVTVPVSSDTIFGVFEYSSDLMQWQKVEYPISCEKELKRIEVHLYFSVDGKIEFLQDLTVDKFYTTDRVALQSVFPKQIGAQPLFRLVSNCDTTFWGYSPTNHFYGTVQRKTEAGWNKFSGSYCVSTVPEKPLHKSDTVYSWIPNYNPGDEYKIQMRGTYKYTVVMGLERYSEGTPMKFFEKGKPRMRTRIFYELESEFVVE